MKTCRGCGETKTFSEYSKHKLGKNGLRPRCKTCCSAEKKAWKAANREHVRAQDKEYRRLNRERISAKNIAWNKAHPVNRKIATLKWRGKNPDKVLGQRYRYRTKKRSTEDAAYATGEKLMARIEYYAGRCFYCWDEADTLDHRIPFFRGGSALPANVVPACRSCNSKKRRMTQTEFLAR